MVAANFIDPVFSKLDVRELFQNDFYKVPHYQRNYAWTREEVKELMDDLRDARQDFPDEPYLLGQIIVAPPDFPEKDFDSTIKQWDLIDGQQRCTTLYLILLCALPYFDEVWLSEASSFEKNQITRWNAWVTLPNKKNEEVPRVLPAGKGAKYLKHFIDSQGELLEPDGPSQENIRNAVQLIRSDYFDNWAKQEIFEFINYTLGMARVYQLAMGNSAQALRVFLKVNNRGLELDPTDVIKSILFRQIDDDEYPEIAERWETAAQILYRARLKRVRFMQSLMKFMIGIRTGTYVPPGKMFDNWEDQLKSKAKVRAFSEEIIGRASEVVRLSEGKNPVSGEKSDEMVGTRERGAIQHYELLMAGTHLQNPRVYERLIQLVEVRFLLNMWSGEKNQLLEQDIHPWAKSISRLSPAANEAELLNVSKKYFSSFDELCASAEVKIATTWSYTTQSHHGKIRYFLGRANRRLQREFTQTSLSLDELTFNTSEEEGFHLDHIFPKSMSRIEHWAVSRTLDAEFGVADRSQKAIHGVGNLVLLAPQDNRDQSDDLPWDSSKKANLGQSELILNRLLSPEPQTTNRKTAEKYQYWRESLGTSLDEWGEESTILLAKFYWKLVRSDFSEIIGH